MIQTFAMLAVTIKLAFKLALGRKYSTYLTSHRPKCARCCFLSPALGHVVLQTSVCVQLAQLKMSMKWSCSAFRVGLWTTDVRGENSLARLFLQVVAQVVSHLSRRLGCYWEGITQQTQKLRQGCSSATLGDHHSFKAAQLAPAPPWNTNLSAPRLVVGSCVALQSWSAAVPALQSCYQPRDEKMKIKVPKGSAWDEEPPWKGSAMQQEIASAFWGTRTAGTDGDNTDNPFKVCFKAPSSWSWQKNSPQK